MTEQEVWEDLSRSHEKWEKYCKMSNDRLLNLLTKINGKAWVKNLEAIFQDCEVGETMWSTQYTISRTKYGEFQDERYGPIKGYWVDQKAVGDSGDSREGYIYVQIKPSRYIKAFYSM